MLGGGSTASSSSSVTSVAQAALHNNYSHLLGSPFGNLPLPPLSYQHQMLGSSFPLTNMPPIPPPPPPSSSSSSTHLPQMSGFDPASLMYPDFLRQELNSRFLQSATTTSNNNNNNNNSNNNNGPPGLNGSNMPPPSSLPRNTTTNNNPVNEFNKSNNDKQNNMSNSTSEQQLLLMNQFLRNVTFSFSFILNIADGLKVRL